ncbi:MAG: ABC transporter substrate-binding protein [Clostridiales bacterium]|nr:ABC transporter substrate-binding protein [Clostridiales bacterium]
MHRKFIPLFISICLLLVACSDSSTQKAREVWLESGTGEITFGMSYPFEVTEANTGFFNGVTMAVAKINESGILGKSLKILKMDDEGTVTTGSEVAQAFVDNPEISAVIGHWNSRVTNAVADIYNRNEMVMITPASTSPLLTTKGYGYIFRKIYNDIDYGSTMASYAAKNGLDKVAIYYADDDYGRGLANAFEDAAYENGIQVIDRTTSVNARNIMLLSDRWNAFDYDAVFVADVIPAAQEVIATIRSAGIHVPILGATGIDRSSFLETMGSNAEDVAIPTVFSPDTQSIEVASFLSDYERLYGKMPDSWAAQGYESILLLCKAIETAGSAMPGDIARAVREMNVFKGLSGVLKCSPEGEILGGDIYVKIVKNGKYVYLGKY